MIWQLSDGRRAVAREPYRLWLADLDLAGQDDLERPFAQIEGRGCLAFRYGQRLLGQAVEAEAMPVELFLQRNHQAEDSIRFGPCLVQAGPDGHAVGAHGQRLVSGEVSAQRVERPGQVKREFCSW